MSQQESQWQKPECNTVAVIVDKDGGRRKINQVSDWQFEVTRYKGRPATASELSFQIDRLRRNYTIMKPDFFAALANELAADEWPIERIKDAVTHTLRVKTGGFMTIADIFMYDKPFKLYNHKGYSWLISSGRATDKDACGPLSDFDKITIEGKVFFYLKKDLPKNQAR